MAAKKNEQDIDPKEVQILADAVMIRSDVLVKTQKLSREEADSLALKQVNAARKSKGLEYVKSYVKNKGKGYVIGPAAGSSGSKGTPENSGPKNKNAPPRTTTTTVAPSSTTSTTVAPTTTQPATETPERIKYVAEWVKNRAATYVAVLGLSPAAAKKKAIEDTQKIDVGTEADKGPFNVFPTVNLEAPGAAKKQLAAMGKATLDPVTNRWKVLGYGLYTEQEYSDILAGLKANVANASQTGNEDTGTPGTPGDGQGKDYGNVKPAKPIAGDTYTNSKNVKFTFQNGKWVRTATLGKTPSTPSTPGATVVVDGKKVVVGSSQWKTIIQEEFGSMWDVYNSDPEVKKVIDESVKLGYFDDETKMTAKLQNTTWFRTTQQSARQFAIQQSTDPATAEAKITASVEDMRANAMAQGFTLNDMTLRKLAADSLKFGWSDQQKLNALGSEQVAQSQLGGAQGMADLRQSATARNLRAKAAAYFQKPSEELIGSWTQQIITGQKSDVQFDELMRSSARTQFRSLQPAIDKGQDIQTAMYAYTEQARATLGSAIDTSQIDWTQDKWNKALNFRDPKTNEYRQMDLWEWNKYLRTLPEWQNTEEAKVAYGNLSQSLARGFGKTA